MLAQDIRPKLPHDTMFLPSEEGVVFRRAGRTLALKGKGIFQLISALAPHLRGEAAVRTLTIEMSGAKAAVVEKLIATLVDDGMLINHSKEDEGCLSPAEREVFGSQIEFLEHLTVDPCLSFKRFREANVVLTGAGFPLAALACSLIRNGARNLTIDSGASMGVWAENVLEAAGEMRGKGLECNIRDCSLTTEPDSDNEGAVDAVCYASDAASINHLLQINTWCRSRQTAFLPGILLGDAFHVGPTVSRSNEVCWECALLRYTDQCTPTEARDLWQQAALNITSNAYPWPDSSPAMRIFANNLGFQIFRHFTGLPTDIGSIQSLDIMTLETKATQIFSHPKCRACAEHNQATKPAQAIERQFSEEPLEAWNEKLQSITPLVDKRFGVFNTFEDDNITQAPLFRSTLLTSQRQHHAESAKRHGSSLENNAAARIAVLFDAATSYALAMRSPDRISPGFALEQQGISRINDESLAGYMGGGRVPGRNCTAEWVIGRSLRTDATLAVPVDAVFPAPRNEAVFFEPTHTGAGCDFSASAASVKALHGLLAFETLKSIAQGELDLRPCRLDTFSGDAYALKCLGMLNVDCDIWVVDRKEFALALAVRRSIEEPGAQVVAVGYGATIGNSIAMATQELLAISLGADSLTSLDAMLPFGLGYHLPPLQRNHDSDWIDAGEKENEADSANLYKLLENREQDVILCDITPRDLASNGLFVIKAVLTTDDRK